MRLSSADPSLPTAPRKGASSAEPNNRSAFRALLGSRTPLSPERAREHLAHAWQTVTGEAAPPLASALLQAQWALETRGGAAMYGHNFGGIKAQSGGALMRTREGFGAAEVSTIDRFRTYADANAGALDYVQLLSKRYPQALDAARAGDAERFTAALADGGYFTANEASYRAALEHWRAHFEQGAPVPASHPTAAELALDGVLRQFERAVRG